ncbi:MAG: dimethylsulfonioproprionate lyase family protein [Rhizobiaceae bacterium]
MLVATEPAGADTGLSTPAALSAFGALFLALADTLDEGTEPIAKTGANALRKGAAEAPFDLPPSPLPMAPFAGVLALTGTHAACGALIPVFDRLNWHHSGLESGQIRADISRQMLTGELVGPDGLVFDDSCRVGLFAQGPNLAYPQRTHAAEELFVMLAGTGLWSQSGHVGVPRGPGARMHHASLEPHSSTTGAEPLVAIWVWTGDIDFSTYLLQG